MADIKKITLPSGDEYDIKDEAARELVNTKQDTLTAAQLAAVNSGVTAEKVQSWDSITVPTKTSELTNDSGFITSVPVTSVNGQTGVVSLDASDVGALPDSTAIPMKTSDLTNDSGFITLLDTLFGQPTGISSGADLDNYTTVGHYSANNGTVASSLSNCPTTANFTLFVFWRTISYKTQVIIPGGNTLFIRYQGSSGWTAWRKISTTAV